MKFISMRLVKRLSLNFDKFEIRLIVLCRIENCRLNKNCRWNKNCRFTTVFWESWWNTTPEYFIRWVKSIDFSIVKAHFKLTLQCWIYLLNVIQMKWPVAHHHAMLQWTDVNDASYYVATHLSLLFNVYLLFLLLPLSPSSSHSSSSFPFVCSAIRSTIV